MFAPCSVACGKPEAYKSWRPGYKSGSLPQKLELNDYINTMEQPLTSLRAVLTRQKPVIPCTAPPSRHPWYKLWPNLNNSVQLWNEFNLDTLNNMYGKVLDFQVPNDQLICPRPHQYFDGVIIKTEKEAKHMISWNYEMMKPCLGFAKSYLQLHDGTQLRHEYSSVAEPARARLPNMSKRATADHIIWLDDISDETLVVGISKTSNTWRGSAIERENNTVRSIAPLRHLANLCKLSNTRYGYIQTDEELVACCFTKETGATELEVMIMPIKWSKHTVNALTTDLALWWMGMLAMSDPKNRIILPKGEMAPLSSLGSPEFPYLDH